MPEKKSKPTISVEVKELDPKALYLNQHFGDGTYGKTKFEASFTLPNMGLVVKIGDKRFLVSSQDIIQEVIKLHEKK